MQNRYGFARRSQPVMGKVDVASVFIDRDKFVDTGIFFSELIFVLFCMCISFL